MRGIKAIVQQENMTGSPVSVKALARQHGVGSLKALVASSDIRHFYHRTNGQWGPLGNLSGTFVKLQSDGAYVQDFGLGQIATLINSTPKGIRRYKAAITLAGVRCFATDDPGGTDEFYMIVTAMSFNADGSGKPEVITKLFPPVEVRTNQNIDVNLDVGEIGVSGSGIRIHVLMMDEEHGDPERVQQRVKDYFLEAGEIASTSIYGAAAWAVVKTILDTKIGSDVFGFLTGFFADLLDDDKIGEQTYTVTNGDLHRLAEQDDEGRFPNFASSLKRGPEGIQYNVGDTLIDEGSGTYKVYLRVEPIIRESPVLPPSDA
jgi:hypothetical protein